MRVPFSWLREYVDWQGTVEELAELLTMSGTEVETIEWVGAPRDPDNLACFVVGRVVTKERHPNADKLNLCRVDVGAAHGGERRIVCGADNFAPGDVVAVALPGAVLGNGLRLRKANLRGVESDGMMLSEQELGYEEESAGIAVLPADWEVGAPLQRYLPVSEAVLELELTSNRPDCFSVYGVAREVAAAAGLPLAPPPTAGPATVGGAPVDEVIAVEVADPDLCPRYAARLTRGVRVAESPAWLKARLTHAGMRPINNVVDVTNYVMLAWGQPLHAFDAAKIEGATLVARRAREGERIVTLDGVERVLDGEMLVIADVRRPLVIAGVFGSVDAEVDEGTTDVVLEAASFNPASILRTEMHTGIRSEASNRFEKGLDPHLVPPALDFASRLFAELCGGTVAPGVVDVVAAPLPEPRRVPYRPAACARLLGWAPPEPEQRELLERLGCEVADGGEEWTVTAPTFRPDLEREVDLIEEVGRLAGYHRVPETLPRHRTAGGLTKAQQVRRAVRRALTGCGLDEAVTYSFIDPGAIAALGLAEDDVRRSPVRLSNPMSVEQSVMRTTLLPGLLAAVRENVARLNPAPNLFELGRVFLWDDEARPAPPHAGEPGAVLPHEAEMLAVVLAGPLQEEHWTGARRSPDFYTLKGVLERLLAELGLEAEFQPLPEAAAAPFLHPGKAALLRLPRQGEVGVCGELHPDVGERLGLEDLTVQAAELRFERLAAAAWPRRPFAELGQYPPASQDLAVVVARDVPAAAVVAAARKAGGKLVRDVRVFDVYEGDQVPPDHRSLALRLLMRSDERTLGEKDIATVRSRILAALGREFGATLR